MAICFAAFAPLRMLRFRHNCYHGEKEPMSEEGGLSEPGRVEASLVRDRGNGKRYLIPSPNNTKQRSLYADVEGSGGRRCLWIPHNSKPRSPGLRKNS